MLDDRLSVSLSLADEQDILGAYIVTSIQSVNPTAPVIPPLLAMLSILRARVTRGDVESKRLGNVEGSGYLLILASGPTVNHEDSS